MLLVYRHSHCFVDSEIPAIVPVGIDGNLVDAAVGFDDVHFGVFGVIAGLRPLSLLLLSPLLLLC